jgi:hypothetical protein
MVDAERSAPPTPMHNCCAKAPRTHHAIQNSASMPPLLMHLDMRVFMSGWLLLTAIACFSMQAVAQQPTSPGSLVVGQVFTGQYDDFGDFGGDSLIIKISVAGGAVLRFNTVSLRFYSPWYKYRALPRPFEGQPCMSHSHAFTSSLTSLLSSNCLQHIRRRSAQVCLHQR